jgi:hypothetical protein
MSASLQYFDFPVDRDRGVEAIAERELWTSVVLQAIDDLTEGPQFLQAKAQRWFESRSEEPRAFRWVCHHLDLNPAAVLKRIRLKQSAREHDLVSQTSINIIPDRFLPSDIEQCTSDTLS